MTWKDIAIFFAGEPLCCPDGHTIPKNSWSISEQPCGGERCKFHPPPGTVGECGKCVFWWDVGGGVRIAIQVPSRALHEMERQRMSPRQVRDYLGLSWRRAA
jgi:hypothetical protein